MQRLLSLLILLVVNHTYAANWMILGETDEHRIELDLESIKKISSSPYGYDKSITQFWIKKTVINDLTKDGLGMGDYSLNLFHINCSNDTLGLKSGIKYKNNKALDSYTESYVKMQPIVPETVGYSYYTVVCSQ